MPTPTSANFSRVAKALADLPEQIRTVAGAASAQSQIVEASDLATWRDELGWSAEDTMRALLPLAAAAAHAPISKFNVGAVAACTKSGAADGPTLYLGANLEFLGGTLSDSVHAEQSAVVRAWLNGASTLTAVATSAAPCGHCRQFLTEVRSPEGAMLLTPDGTLPLSASLPGGFDSGALGSSARLFDDTRVEVNLAPSVEAGPLVTRAVWAAQNSHTPYSGCPSGAAVELASGRVVSGRALESVAFNPSLSPVQSALAQLGHTALTSDPIVAACLAEAGGAVSHASRDARLLKLVAPGVELEVLTLRR